VVRPRPRRGPKRLRFSGKGGDPAERASNPARTATCGTGRAPGLPGGRRVRVPPGARAP